ELCTGRLIDPFDGEGDVRRRVLRPVTPQAIANDPIRAVRAVRLAAELGFSMDASLLEAIRRDAGGLTENSPERIQQELHRMLALPGSAEALRRMSALGLWQYTIPELDALAGVSQSAPHQLDVWDHILLTTARLEELLRGLGLPAEGGGRLVPEEWAFLKPYRPALRRHLEQELAEERPRWQALKWAALLHDIAKPAARRVDELGRVRFLGHERRGAEMAEEVMRRLRFSQREISYVCACVTHHLRPLLLSRESELTPRAQYRFFRDLGDAALGVCLLSLADTAACRPGRPPAEVWEPVQRVVQALLEFYSRTGGPAGLPRLVTGDDLVQRFGLAPGPTVGKWLERVREEQAAGTFTTRDEALRWLEQMVSGEEGEKSL
ncbi:MAG: HD domain-containing protein, partial [Anaerolineae bacterium]